MATPSETWTHKVQTSPPARRAPSVALTSAVATISSQGTSDGDRQTVGRNRHAKSPSLDGADHDISHTCNRRVRTQPRARERSDNASVTIVDTLPVRSSFPPSELPSHQSSIQSRAVCCSGGTSKNPGLTAKGSRVCAPEQAAGHDGPRPLGRIFDWPRAALAVLGYGLRQA